MYCYSDYITKRSFEQWSGMCSAWLFYREYFILARVASPSHSPVHRDEVLLLSPQVYSPTVPSKAFSLTSEIYSQGLCTFEFLHCPKLYSRNTCAGSQTLSSLLPPLLPTLLWKYIYQHLLPSPKFYLEFFFFFFRIEGFFVFRCNL